MSQRPQASRMHACMYVNVLRCVNRILVHVSVHARMLCSDFLCMRACHASTWAGPKCFFRPNSRADWEGPWATCDTISGPGTRCFGGTVRPGRPENVPCLVLALPEDHPLPETRGENVRGTFLVPWAPSGPAIPPISAQVPGVCRIVDLTPLFFRCALIFIDIASDRVRRLLCTSSELT